MQTIIEIFKDICKIPHCSGNTKELRDFIVSFSKSFGYSVETDDVGNIIARAKKAKITLQSHYDMVCIGDAPNIKTVEQDGWMFAKESSLGADNGIGVAMMLFLMQKRKEAGFLFTNDEEIGLIGAVALSLEINTPYMLNLDSEELGKVYIGCAGGVDIFAKKTIEWEITPEDGNWFLLKSSGAGGHSGVNIADNILNAIAQLCRVIYENPKMKVANIKGGERINSIPKYAEAIVWLPNGYAIKHTKSCVTTIPLSNPPTKVLKDGRKIATTLFSFAHGVREWNTTLSLPHTSINLALVDIEEDEISISLSGRSMSNDDLTSLINQTVAWWELLGYSCTTNGKYPAWNPTVDEFSKKVLECYKKKVPNASYAAIHAGLECAIFAKKYPNLKIASIGPTILDPHSDRERVDLDSVSKVMDIVEQIISKELKNAKFIKKFQFLS